jgi:hypothetical protein
MTSFAAFHINNKRTIQLFLSINSSPLLLPVFQMGVPQLRPPTSQRTFNADLEKCEYDLDLWRRTSPKARQCDFELMDRAGGAGWDLACRLVRRRDKFNRGRLSAAQALRHRYFWGDA